MEDNFSAWPCLLAGVVLRLVYSLHGSLCPRSKTARDKGSSVSRLIPARTFPTWHSIISRRLQESKKGTRYLAESARAGTTSVERDLARNAGSYPSRDGDTQCRHEVFSGLIQVAASERLFCGTSSSSSPWTSLGEFPSGGALLWCLCFTVTRHAVVPVLYAISSLVYGGTTAARFSRAVQAQSSEIEGSSEVGLNFPAVPRRKGHYSTSTQRVSSFGRSRCWLWWNVT